MGNRGFTASKRRGALPRERAWIRAWEWDPRHEVPQQGNVAEAEKDHQKDQHHHHDVGEADDKPPIGFASGDHFKEGHHDVSAVEDDQGKQVDDGEVDVDERGEPERLHGMVAHLGVHAAEDHHRTSHPLGGAGGPLWDGKNARRVRKIDPWKYRICVSGSGWVIPCMKIPIRCASAFSFHSGVSSRVRSFPPRRMARVTGLPSAFSTSRLRMRGVSMGFPLMETRRSPLRRPASAAGGVGKNSAHADELDFLAPRADARQFQVAEPSGLGGDIAQEHEFAVPGDFKIHLFIQHGGDAEIRPETDGVAVDGEDAVARAQTRLVGGGVGGDMFHHRGSGRRRLRGDRRNRRWCRGRGRPARS